MDRRTAKIVHSPRPMRLKTAVLALLLLAAPVVMADLGRKWHDEIAESSTYLRAGEFARSLKVSSGVVKDMVAHLGGGGVGVVDDRGQGAVEVEAQRRLGRPGRQLVQVDGHACSPIP